MKFLYLENICKCLNLIVYVYIYFDANSWMLVHFFFLLGQVLNASYKTEFQKLVENLDAPCSVCK